MVMIFKLLKTLFLLLLGCLGCCDGVVTEQMAPRPAEEISAHQVKQRVLLWKAVTSLGKGLDYFLGERQKLTTDAMVGLGIVQGLVRMATRRACALKCTEDKTRNDFCHVLRRTRKNARYIQRISLPFVNKTQGTEMAKFQPMVASSFWIPRGKFRSLGNQNTLGEASDSGINHVIDEAESDKCIGEILKFNKGGRNYCDVSAECWKRMMNSKNQQYPLTHQIIYMLALSRVGCLQEPETRWKLRALCRRVYNESRQIAKANFSPQWRDLFMEQITLCGGLLAFNEFMRSRWLERLASWQDASGCWKRTQEEIIAHVTFGKPYSHFRGKPYQRIRRREYSLKERCLVHRTTVGLTALSSFCYYLTDTLARSHSLC